MPHRKKRTGGQDRKRKHDDPAAHSTAYRARFQRLVSNISASLISLAPHEIEGWMNSVLELIGAFEGVDRSYVFLFNGSGDTMDNTHEWCADGVEPQIGSLKNIPLSTFPWWMMKLKSNEEVNIPLVAKLPPEAAEERKILEAQRIKSLLAVPINVEGRVCGFLGFDSVKLPRRWTKGSVVLIRTIASTLGNALARKRAEEARQKAVDMLRESESRWQFALEGAGDGVWDWNVESGKVFFSRRWKEMLGYAEEEVGDGLEEWSSRVHPE
ncbi:MAG TPA: GAF domain-containing protein, partial [Elusimicrobiales bacterium]|nr:GAF domain-containing protein [Elusimicrobiales bacterium]